MTLHDLTRFGFEEVNFRIEIKAVVGAGDSVIWSGETGVDPNEYRWDRDPAQPDEDRCSLYVSYLEAGTKRLVISVAGDDFPFQLEIQPPRFPPPPPPRLPPITILGEPQVVPDLTLISRHTVQPGDSFPKFARAYHDEWGLRPKFVDSVEDVLERIARAIPGPERVRIVSHASFVGILLRLFKDGPVGVTSVHLDMWADSDGYGMLRTLDLPDESDLRAVVLDRLRATDAQVLQPFGLDTTGSPQGPTAILFTAATNLLLDRTGHLFLNGRAQVPEIDAGLNAVMSSMSAEIAVRGGPSTTQSRALSRAILRLGDIFPPGTRQDLNLDQAGDEPDYLAQVRSAVKAVKRGWRTKLDRARANLKPDARIDIGGCRIGSNPAALASIARFLGRPGQPPTVSAPIHEQWFGQAASRVLYIEDNDFVQLAHDPPVAAAVLHWAEITGVSAELNWPAGTSSDPENLRLSYYLHRAKVLPLGVATYPVRDEVDVQVTLYVHPSFVGGVGSQGSRRLDRDGVEAWLASQWTPVNRAIVGRLVRRWLAGTSPSYTAIINVIAGEDTAVVASDTAFHSRFRTS